MQKRRIEKSPTETLKTFKDVWTEESVSGHEFGNFDSQVDDFLVDGHNEINLQAIICKIIIMETKIIDAQQDTEQGFELQEMEIDNKEQKPKSRNKVLSESELATLQDANTL